MEVKSVAVIKREVLYVSYSPLVANGIALDWTMLRLFDTPLFHGRAFLGSQNRFWKPEPGARCRL